MTPCRDDHPEGPGITGRTYTVTLSEAALIEVEMILWKT